MSFVTRVVFLAGTLSFIQLFKVSPQFHEFRKKIYVKIIVITIKLLLFFGQKGLLMVKLGVFLTIFTTKKFLRNYVSRELADLRVFGKFLEFFGKFA